jgi:hypothetical protein
MENVKMTEQVLNEKVNEIVSLLDGLDMSRAKFILNKALDTLKDVSLVSKKLLESSSENQSKTV